MIVNGFALVKPATQEELLWWREIPQRIDIPSKDIVLFGAKVGWENEGYAIVARAKEFPDPEPERRSVLKSTIMERLTDAQLDRALAIMTTRQKERWRMPGRPRLFADDPEVIGLMQAVGADPAVVLADGDV